MISIEELERKMNFPQRYRELALKFSDQANCHWAKPKKDEMLTIFNKLGYNVKYIPIDRLYIEQYKVGILSFEYYYEFNGMNPWIFIYIKRRKASGLWSVTFLD